MSAEAVLVRLRAWEQALAEDWRRPGIMPDEGLFLSSAAWLEQFCELQRITMDGDDDGDCPWEEELSARDGRDVQMFFRRAYLIFAFEAAAGAARPDDLVRLDWSG